MLSVYFNIKTNKKPKIIMTTHISTHAEQIPIMHYWTARDVGEQVAGLNDADPKTCWTADYDDLEKQVKQYR